MTTTREQRLRELVEKWRERVISDDDHEYKEGFYAAQDKCADELAAILAETVNVTSKMVNVASLAYNDAIENSHDGFDLPWCDEDAMRSALTAALREPGQ